MDSDTIIYQSSLWKDSIPSDYRDYRDLDILAENQKVKLVPYDDKYFNLHLKLSLELYPYMASPIARNEGMREGYRNMILNESKELKVIVFDTATSQHIGEVIAKPPVKGVIELGWDILPKFQRQGYATAAVKLLMQLLFASRSPRNAA